MAVGGALVALVCLCANAQDRTYEVPPSDVTRLNVPVISDQAMEECVKLYNEIEWLGEDVDRTSVNRYSQHSVDSYNRKVSQHSEMTNRFNRDCAGKQSESAYRAAQKLNQQQR